MLSKISKIKKLGLVFSDFDWSPETPLFHEVNLVYGYNGCGKTTLTRLFDKVSRSSTDGVEYDLESSDGKRFSAESQFPFPIRVFNNDYLIENVRILDGSANAISIVLGAENKELVAKIEADEIYLNGDPKDATKPGTVYELNGQTRKKARLEKETDAAFTEVAKTIGAAIGGNALRSYRSPQAKADFAKITKPEALTSEELEDKALILKQEMLDEVPTLQLPLLEWDGKKLAALEVLSACVARGKELGGRTAESEVVERLKDNPDIAEWVEQGLVLHAKHSSSGCEYCGNAISTTRLAELGKHFSEADQLLKSALDAALNTLRNVHIAVRDAALPDSARLYAELRPNYQASVTKLDAARTSLLAQITELGKALQNKKSRTTESIVLSQQVNADEFEVSVNETNRALLAHNEKSRAFKLVQEAAAAKLRTHFLSAIYQTVTDRKAEIAKLDGIIATLTAGTEEARQRVAKAKAEISSAHKGCDEINAGLKTFLGHDEFRFEPELKLEEGSGEEKVSGYRIVRGDKPATYLSEGEKTAIAFIYFVVHLGDGVFKKADGIVVIDDPISSLDSNSLYQAFSFLKNAVKGCRQTFILTHNFDFLKLLLNWRSQGRRQKTGFYMIKNHFVGDDRRATIEPMEKELRDYESEYHYLFKCLKGMRGDQDGTIMRAYPVPNVARKVWETFLLYCVPSGQSPYAKAEQLKDRKFDAEKLDAIYKFTNDNSHVTGAGFNPALVPETRNVLGHIFDMMKEIAPDHYAVLDKATPLA